MGKTFGLAKSILGKPKEEEDFSKYKTNCRGQPDAKSPFKDSKVKVIFPEGKAVQDKRVTLRGGCIVKLSLGKEIESALDEDQRSKLIGFNRASLNRTKEKYPGSISNYTEYIDKVVLNTNKIILGISEKSKDLEEMGSYFVSGYKSSSDDQEVTSFNNFVILMQTMKVRNRNAKRLFRFGFIPFEACKSILDQTAPLADSIGLKSHYGKTVGSIKEDISKIDTLGESEKEDAIKGMLTSITPIHKLSRNSAESMEDTSEQLGYYTYYKDSIYFVFPDMTLEDSQGVSPNFYNFGETKSSFRFYLTLEMSLFGQIKYLPISYIPAPAPILADNILEEVQSSESFTLELSKDGLIGGDEIAFSDKLKAPKYDDYTIILSPKSNQLVSSFNFGIQDFKNSLEYFSIPNILSKNYFIDVDKNLEKLSEAIKSPSVTDNLKLLMGSKEYEKALKTNNSFDDEKIKKFLKDNGFPSFYPKSSIGFKNFSYYFGFLGREDFIISSLDKQVRSKKNDSKIYQKKIASSSPLFSSIRRHYISEDDIPKLCISEKFSDLTPKDISTDNPLEQQISSDSSKDFTLSFDASKFKDLDLDQQKEFVVYILDSYGQLSRVPFGTVTIQKDKPEILKISPDGFEEAVFSKDLVKLDIKGDSLLNITSIAFYSGPAAILPYKKFDVGESDILVTKSSVDSFNFILSGSYEDMITANIGALWVELVNKNSLSSNRVPVHVTNVSVEEIPDPPLLPTLLNPDSIRAVKNSKIPIPMTGEISNCPIITFKSKDKCFGDSEIYLHLASKVGPQSEEEIREILQDFSFKSNLYKASNISDGTSNSTYIISSSLSYSLNSNEFYSTSKKESKFIFPGNKYIKFNISNIDKLQNPCFFFTNRPLNQFGLDGDSINSEKLENSYSIASLGNDNDPPFIKPPSILNIILKSNPESDVFSNNIITEKISKILSGENDSKKVVFSPDEISKAKMGSELYVGNTISRMAVVAEGHFTSRSISDYKMSIGDSNFGFGIFDKIKSLLTGNLLLSESFEIEDAGSKKSVVVFALSNVEVEDRGLQQLVISKKDRDFKTKYDSSLRHIETVNSYSFAETEEEGKKEITFEGSIEMINKSGLLNKSHIPVKKEFLKNKICLSNMLGLSPSAVIGLYGIRYEQDTYITNSKQFFKEGDFMEFGPDGKLSIGNITSLITAGEEGQESFSELKNAFNFSDSAFVNISIPDVSIDASTLEGLAESSLEFIESAEDLLSVDAKLDPLSSGFNLVNNALESIEDAASILSNRENAISAFDNNTFYLSPNNTKFDSQSYISESVSPLDYPNVKTPQGSNLFYTLYKAFLNIEIKNNALLMVNMPRLVSITKNNIEFTVDELQGLTFGANDILDFKFENLYDEDFKVEFNKKRVDVSDLKISANGLTEFRYEVSQEFLDLNFSAFQLDDPCFEVSLSPTNALHFSATKSIGNDLTINFDKRMDEIYNGNMLNDRKDGKDWGNLALEFPLKWSAYIADKSQTLLELRDSFCDLSFSITGQFSAYLSGFKNILTIIKVIFCIIDVICALLNPVKLAFATIRLFTCLYDLILLLPQIAVPVALLSLILHLLELLKCLIEKILYIIRAINEISAALEDAILEKDMEAIMNLERVLSEYILELETDIQVLEPIIDILKLFLELLQLFFSFPCSPGEGSSDEFRECQLDSSLVAGLILSKVTGEAGDGLNPENLLPVAQTYTTLSVDDLYGSVQCGNTPSGTENDNLSWMGDCNYEGDILREPSPEYIGRRVAFKNSENDGFLENTEVDPKTFRTIDPGDPKDENFFQAAYAISFTKSTKNPSNLSEALIKGPDPRKVTFQFNSKGITNGLGYVPILGLIFRKKLMDINQCSDTPFFFLNKDGDEYKVAEISEDGAGLYSPIDGFSGFMRGNESEGFYPRPLTVEFEAGEGDQRKTWERTFEDLPMFAIVDDAFNVYFINENGIKIDPKTKAVESIEARIISTASAPKRGTEKEDEEVIKNESVLAEQANYNWLTSLPNSPDPEDGLFSFTKRVDDAHDIDFDTIREKAEEWGEWTDFDTEFDAQVPFKVARDEDGVEQDARSYDYAGGFITDKIKLSNAIDSVKVYDFPQLYFVDVRQVADELQSACTISDVNSILLGGPSNEEVANNVNEVLECVGKFKDSITKKISDLKSKVENGQIPGLISVEEVEGEYKALVECLTDAADKACNIVINPYNTSFLLSADQEENETDYADPSEIESENLEELLEFAAGLRENFDSPNITGASEFASGIGTEVNAKINEEVEIITIPRDSYDSAVENVEFETKINIQIVSDTTGSAKIKRFDFNGNIAQAEKSEDGTHYKSFISASTPGIIKIKASICGKTIKAFTYSNIVQTSGPEDQEQLDCVEDSIPIDQEELSLGALVEVDRVLTINISDKDVFLGVASPDLNDVALDPQTSPQTHGTKLEN